MVYLCIMESVYWETIKLFEFEFENWNTLMERWTPIRVAHIRNTVC